MPNASPYLVPPLAPASFADRDLLRDGTRRRVSDLDGCGEAIARGFSWSRRPTRCGPELGRATREPCSCACRDAHLVVPQTRETIAVRVNDRAVVRRDTDPLPRRHKAEAPALARAVLGDRPLIGRPFHTESEGEQTPLRIGVLDADCTQFDVGGTVLPPRL